MSFLVSSSILMSNSCKKFVEIPPPPIQVESVKIFSDELTAVSAVTGVYAMLAVGNSNLLNGGITLYTAAASDEINTSASNTDLDPFLTNSISPSHSNLWNRLWRAAYNNNCIYSANAVADGLTKSTNLTEPVRNELIAEVKVIRALAYFYLVNMYGDVPLILDIDYQKNASLARHPIEGVYKQIKQDLIFAFNTLNVTYPTSGRARVNKWVAGALLARVCLYMGDWREAEMYSTNVIESGQYSLNNDLATVFTNTNSNETIWHLVRDNSPAQDGANFIPASTTTRPTYILSPSLMSSFENGDKRKMNWIAKNTVSSIEYYYPYKYKSRTATQPREYSVLFRLAEQYLVRAEARNQLDDPSGAVSDLNLIRVRAGLPTLPLLDKSQMLDAIVKERRVELFCEMGHRWFDLKRTKRADAVLSIVKGSNWQSTDVLFPIPETEIARNPFLTQNPGYTN